MSGVDRLDFMMERFQQVAVIGIFFALVWIAWEIRNKDHVKVEIDGSVDANCYWDNRRSLHVNIDK